MTDTHKPPSEGETFYGVVSDRGLHHFGYRPKPIASVETERPEPPRRPSGISRPTSSDRSHSEAARLRA